MRPVGWVAHHGKFVLDPKTTQNQSRWALMHNRIRVTRPPPGTIKPKINQATNLKSAKLKSAGWLPTPTTAISTAATLLPEP